MWYVRFADVKRCLVGLEVKMNKMEIHIQIKDLWQKLHQWDMTKKVVYI